MELLANHPVLFCLVSLLLMSLAAWVGAVVLRQKKPMDEATVEDFSVVQSATLTLLALVIGFSLSMAVGRYDQRKNYEEEEANAIGTEYLRTDLLPANGAKTRQLLRQYTDLRIQFYTTRDADALKQVDEDTSRVQNEMWAAVSQPAIGQPNPVVGLAVGGMNDVINSQGYTLAAWRNRIPGSAWMLLFAIGIFCNILLGFGVRMPNVKLLMILPLVVAIAFFLIADIDSPRRGRINVRPQNLETLRTTLK